MKQFKREKKNADYLDEELRGFEDKIILPDRPKDWRETHALYMGLFENRDDLVQFLTSNGIEVKIHYPKPLHLQPAAKKDCRIMGPLVNAESQADKLMTIPVHQYLNDDHMGYVTAKIKSFYGF